MRVRAKESQRRRRVRAAALQRIRNVIFRREGQVNKMLVDDKGVVLLARLGCRQGPCGRRLTQRHFGDGSQLSSTALQTPTTKRTTDNNQAAVAREGLQEGAGGGAWKRCREGSSLGRRCGGGGAG